jgi:hypothetical protein
VTRNILGPAPASPATLIDKDPDSRLPRILRRSENPVVLHVKRIGIENID